MSAALYLRKRFDVGKEQGKEIHGYSDTEYDNTKSPKRRVSAQRMTPLEMCKGRQTPVNAEMSKTQLLQKRLRILPSLLKRQRNGLPCKLRKGEDDKGVGITTRISSAFDFKTSIGTNGREEGKRKTHTKGGGEAELAVWMTRYYTCAQVLATANLTFFMQM